MTRIIAHVQQHWTAVGADERLTLPAIGTAAILMAHHGHHLEDVPAAGRITTRQLTTGLAELETTGHAHRVTDATPSTGPEDLLIITDLPVTHAQAVQIAADDHTEVQP